MMNDKSEEIFTILAKADLLYNESDILTATDRMATTINQRLVDKQLLCLPVMIGGMIWAGQLLTRLNLPIIIDYIHASRYRGNTSGSILHWLKQPTVSLENKTILLIDDILDEGITLQAISKYCWDAGAKEVLTAVLVEKQLDSRSGLQKADFTGLTVPNRYVFGYGMDYQEQLRQVPGIYAVHGL